MTAKTAFTEEEWDLVREGPTAAGFMVITAQRGGVMRETMSMAKAYIEAQKQPGGSELIDALVADKPKMDRTKHSSPEELRDYALAKLREAVALLESKATSQEVSDYKRFVIDVATRAAEAHEEKGNDHPISADEQAALTAISSALA